MEYEKFLKRKECLSFLPYLGLEKEEVLKSLEERKWEKANSVKHSERKRERIISFVNKKAHGKEIVFSNGKLLIKRKWYMGARDGTETVWYPSGKVQSRCEWRRDNRIGEWILWYGNGKMMKRTTFYGFNQHKIEKWTKKGKLVWSCCYYQERKHGQEVKWYMYDESYETTHWRYGLRDFHSNEKDHFESSHFYATKLCWMNHS